MSLQSEPVPDAAASLAVTESGRALRGTLMAAPTVGVIVTSAQFLQRRECFDLTFNKCTIGVRPQEDVCLGVYVLSSSLRQAERTDKPSSILARAENHRSSNDQAIWRVRCSSLSMGDAPHQNFSGLVYTS